MKPRGQPMKRKALRRKGARSEREAEELAVFRTLVLEMAQYECERCGNIPPLDVPPDHPEALNAHHRLPRSRGGKHELTNGAALCGRCHSAVHDHTARDWRDWITQTKPKKERTP